MKESIDTGQNKQDLNDREVMREASLEAIREGNALPTPMFAVEEGQEMVTLLTHEIEKLDGKQLDDLMENINSVRSLKTGEAVDALRDKFDVYSAKGIGIPLILGWIIGAMISGTSEGGGVGAGVATVLKKSHDNVKANRRIENVNAKMEFVLQLIENVKAKRQKIASGNV